MIWLLDRFLLFIGRLPSCAAQLAWLLIQTRCVVIIGAAPNWHTVPFTGLGCWKK